jgi:hypothetical protein
VSIEFGWRRIAAADIAGRTPKELSGLAPTFRAAHEGAVVGALLGLGDGGSHGAEAFVDMPADWDDEYLVGTVGPDGVREIAAAMRAAKWRAWLTAHFDELAAGAEQAGYDDAMGGAAPDGPWADHLLRIADALTRLFVEAAAAGESVVFSMSA